MTFSEAARELRGANSQQFFATRLGVSICALQNYEKGKVHPDARAIAAYLLVSDATGRVEVTDFLGCELYRALGIDLLNAFDARRLTKCLRALLPRNGGKYRIGRPA